MPVRGWSMLAEDREHLLMIGCSLRLENIGSGERILADARGIAQNGRYR